MPHGKHLRVHTGDRVEAGDPLIEGPLVPHDILRIKGEEALQQYLLREVQNVYRTQSVDINDKHIEIIVAQMLRKVKVERPGRHRLPARRGGRQVPLPRGQRASWRRLREDRRAGRHRLPPGRRSSAREDFDEENARAEARGQEAPTKTPPKPATARRCCWASPRRRAVRQLHLGGASFQETTKVLTEAALAGKVDTWSA